MLDYLQCEDSRGIGGCRTKNSPTLWQGFMHLQWNRCHIFTNKRGTYGIHAFFINLRNPIPLQRHESPPFASPEAKSCFCFPSLWQSKRKKAELFLQRTALAEITEVLLNIGEISGVQVFIDGTKMESAADWYTFVWKKAVTKFQNRLAERRAVFVEGLELSYGIRGNFINLFPYYIYLSS